MNLKVIISLIFFAIFISFNGNIIWLNDSIGVGLIIFFLLQLLLFYFMIKGNKVSWWIFTIFYGLVSVVLFIHNFIFGNITDVNIFLEIIITTGVLIMIFNKKLKNYFLKK